MPISDNWFQGWNLVDNLPGGFVNYAKNSSALAFHGGVAYDVPPGNIQQAQQFWSSKDGYQWTVPGPPAGPAFYSHGHAYFKKGGSTYICGGFTDVTESAVKANTQKVTGFKTAAPNGALPRPVAGHKMITFKGKAWLFGGLSDIGGPLAPIDEIWSSSDVNSWTKSGSVLPIPLYNYALAKKGGSLYLAGGQTTGGVHNDLVWKSGNGETWTLVSGPGLEMAVLPGGGVHSFSFLYSGGWFIFGGDLKNGVGGGSLPGPSGRIHWNKTDYWATDAFMPGNTYDTPFAQLYAEDCVFHIKGLQFVCVSGRSLSPGIYMTA